MVNDIDPPPMERIHQSVLDELEIAWKLYVEQLLSEIPENEKSTKESP